LKAQSSIVKRQLTSHNMIQEGLMANLETYENTQVILDRQAERNEAILRKISLKRKKLQEIFSVESDKVSQSNLMPPYLY
jgi:ribosomal protein S6